MSKQARRAEWFADLRRWGLRRFLHKRMMMTLRPLLFLSRIYTRRFAASDMREDPPPGYEVRFASREELLQAAEDPSMGLSPEGVSEALERGDVCSAIFHEGRLVAYMWRSFTRAPHADGLWVAFEKPYRYGYKALTHVDHRGKHLSSVMGPHADFYSLERGFDHTIGFVETHNYPSITSEVRRGNRPIGYAGYLRAFGRVFPFRSPGVRRAGFAFYRPDEQQSRKAPR